MKRSWSAILFTAILGLVTSGCNTAAPAPYYSSRRDLLGQPATTTPPNSINQRLSGSPPASPNQDAVPSTNSPPRQMQ
jgi:hypothetical protein